MLWSMSVEARPVRTPASSFRTKSICPSMRFLISAKSPFRSFTSITDPLSRGHDRPHRFTHDDPPDIARCLEVEDENRQLVVHAERNRGGVHYLQALLEDLQVRDLLVADRVRMLHGIRVVDPVHFGGLEDD